MCPAAITGTSRYTTVGATTLPRPLLRRFRAAEDVGPRETTPPHKEAPVSCDTGAFACQKSLALPPGELSPKVTERACKAYLNTGSCPLFFPQGQGAPGHHRVGVIVDVSAPDPLDGVVALPGQDDHRPLRGLQNGLLHRPGTV